jgi:hypothetical protein
MALTISEGVKAAEEKKKRHRSPNYPTIGLREAVDRTKKFVTENGKAGAIPAIAVKLIGFASAHGQAYSALSALKKFGLLEERDGRVIPTQRGMEVTSLPDADPRRLKAIRDAVVSPAIYAELIEQYKDTNIPNDETLTGELVTYKGFNPNGVREFLKAFRETLEFAGLSDLSVLGSELQGESGKEKPKIGDFIQWEHNNVLGFHESKKLLGFSEDGKFVFVEGYKTGLPVEEIIPAEAPAHIQKTPPAPFGGFSPPPVRAARQGTTMRQEVFSTTEGEVVLNWPSPLSETSIQDLQDWLELVKRKISRAAPAKTETKENPEPAPE